MVGKRIFLSCLCIGESDVLGKKSLNEEAFEKKIIIRVAEWSTFVGVWNARALVHGIHVFKGWYDLMKTPEVWSPTFSTKNDAAPEKKPCRRRLGAWNLRQNLAFVHISKGQRGREVGKGYYLLFSSKPITVWRCCAEYDQFWQEGWRIWVYLYQVVVFWVRFVLMGLPCAKKTEAVRLLDKDCLPRRRWWSHKVLGWLKGSLRGFFLRVAQ